MRASPESKELIMMTNQYLPQPATSALGKMTRNILIIATLVAGVLAIPAKNALAETCTPQITLKGNNTTGPITSSVGAPVVWSYETMCAERVEFFVRTKSTTGNCSMSALTWAGWRGSETATSKTFPAENNSECQAGGDWEVAAIAIKGNVASTSSTVSVNILPSGRSTVTAGSGTTSTYTLGGKATVRDRANGTATDRVYQQLVTDEPSMVNFVYNTAREGVRDWNAKNTYTYGDPTGLYSELASRFGSGGDVGINTFVTRIAAATSSTVPTIGITTTDTDWVWTASTNPTSGCSRAGVLFGINTIRNVSMTIQTMTASACSGDTAATQMLVAERKKLGDSGIKQTIVHSVPDDAPLPDMSKGANG
jgi:hypothetical protein